MSKAKIIAIKIVVFLLLIAICLTISYFFHGLMYDLIHKSEAVEPPAILEPNKPNQDDKSDVEIKEIISTTIVSEKYGTFVVPKDIMAVSTYTPILYRNGTDLTILKKEIADYYVSLDTNFNINDFDICLHVINNNSTTLKYSEKKTGYPNYELYIFNNNVVEYNSDELEQEAERIYLIAKTGNNAPMLVSQKIIVANVSTEINYMPMQITASINSDKGYPLTELMYKEMLADETTKITYNYAE
ncbi:MAG: hypothetical protein K2L47_02115 [Clostridia bacterium]|nr:hypothetical protein [Clostridia bacterium]